MLPRRITTIAGVLVLVGIVFFVGKFSSGNNKTNSVNHVSTIITEVKGESQLNNNLQTASIIASPEIIEHLELSATNIIWYTNQYRLSEGLPELQARAELRRSSRAKNRDMFEYQYFDHHRPSGFGFDRFIDAEKYSFIKIGENLAMGDFRTSKEVVDAWMNSPEHKQNILDPMYTTIGVSLETDIIFDKEVILITQHFAQPKTECPLVNRTLKKKIDTLNSSLGDLKNNIAVKRGEIDKEQNDTTLKKLITEHNQLIEKYNEMTIDVGNIIKMYNQQVVSFETCAASLSRGE